MPEPRDPGRPENGGISFGRRDFGRLPFRRRRKPELTITDTTWAGLLLQALDGYAKTGLIPADVARLVVELQARMVEEVTG